jgi:hypothetical protein
MPWHLDDDQELALLGDSPFKAPSVEARHKGRQPGQA